MISLWIDLIDYHGGAGAGIALLAFMGAFAIAEVFLCAPVADRFMVTRTGWRLRIGRRWYRAKSVVMRDGEPLYVLDWLHTDYPVPVTWVLAMATDTPEGEDDCDAWMGWITLGSLSRGPSRRRWRQILREGAAA